MPETARSHARFDATDWSLIERVRQGDRAALESVSSSYWAPVYAHLRRRGLSPDHAEEVTQGFFTDVVLARRLFHRADQSKGRLRTLILAAIHHYYIDLVRPPSLSSVDPMCQVTAQSRTEADIVFHREWGAAVLRSAIDRCEKHFRKKEKVHHWLLFERRVLCPAESGNASPPLNEVAEEFGFDSPADAAAAVQVVKKRLLALLRELVAETLTDQREVEAELSELKRVLTE